MDFSFTPEEEAFRREVAEFLDRETTPEVLAEGDSMMGPGPAGRALLRKLGAKRWLCITWPREYGGMGGSSTQRLILQDEMAYRGLGFNLVGPNMAGPTILIDGSEEIKKEYLPRIASGEIEFALGYSEPNAGSDLASLEISAVEDGDDYVMNGQKIFNTDAHYAEYHWLGARTDPDATKHKGISLFVVDLKSPGITVRPLYCLDGMRTNEVFYDNVRVPKKNLVGQTNRGFYHIMTALAFERIFPTGGSRRLFENLVEYVKRANRDGKPLGEDPLIRQRMAEIAADIEVVTLLAYRVPWLIDQGIIPDYQAAMLKLYLTELTQRTAKLGLEIMKDYAQLTRDSKWAQFHGRVARVHCDGFRGTIVGGTSEIQRIVIANRGLNMPRG
ncbi:acyl-CoA dehydrogenase family protein [Thermodesulfobacteriota bacterium]